MSEPSDAVIAAFEAWLDEPYGDYGRRRDNAQEHELPLLREAWLRARAWTLRAERERIGEVLRQRLTRLNVQIEMVRNQAVSAIWMVDQETVSQWKAMRQALRGVLRDAGLEDA